MSTALNVIAQTHRQTDTHKDTTKTLPLPHTCEVIKHWNSIIWTLCAELNVHEAVLLKLSVSTRKPDWWAYLSYPRAPSLHYLRMQNTEGAHLYTNVGSFFGFSV